MSVCRHSCDKIEQKQAEKLGKTERQTPMLQSTSSKSNLSCRKPNCNSHHYCNCYLLQKKLSCCKDPSMPQDQFLQQDCRKMLHIEKFTCYQFLQQCRSATTDVTNMDSRNK
jgi:hypothetical protein